MDKNSLIINQVEDHQKNKQLTSAEIADLFSNFLDDSMFSCVFEHYLQIVEDDAI